MPNQVACQFVKEIASTFRSYAARHLHFVANDKKGSSLFPRPFLGDQQALCLE